GCARNSAARAVWCERGDSNPHGLPRQLLRLVRLPIPPLSRTAARVRLPLRRERRFAKVAQALETRGRARRTAPKDASRTAAPNRLVYPTAWTRATHSRIASDLARVASAGSPALAVGHYENFPVASALLPA